MDPNRAPAAAAIYCRISLDKSGEGFGIARQEELCRRLAKSKGWPVLGVYRDESVSAFSGKRRPEFQRMLVDVEAGRVDAIICVDLDRLVRQPRELEGLMALCDARGVVLANTSGDIDLSTSDGRLRARIMGAVAAQESERKSERQTREAEQAARRGIPRGSQRPFGWEPDRMTLREPEAEIIRQAGARVLAGETPGDIARDLSARGIPTSHGARYGWSAQTVTNILRNPRLCALRTYKGEIVGPGQWTPILTRDDWEQLHSRLRRGPSPGRPGSHLLSGIARCGRCGGPLWSGTKAPSDGGTVRYQCVKRPGSGGCGGLTVAAAPLDATIRAALIAALAGPGLAKARSALAGDDAERRAAAKALADAEGRRDEAARMFAEGELSRREWSTVRETTAARIAAATRLLDRQAVALARLPVGEVELGVAWDEGSIAWRRALLAAVVDRVTVAPSAGHANRFDPNRISITWRV